MQKEKGSINSHLMSVKKFLIVTWKNDAGQLAYELKKEGHQVKVWISYKTCIDTFDGLLDKVRNWKDYISWADVIIFDEVGFGKEADELRAKGKKVVGCSRYTDKLEWDRKFGQEEMETMGIAVPFIKEFTSFKDGLDYIRKSPGQYVFKPIGAVTMNHHLLSVSTDKHSKDLEQLLVNNRQRWKNRMKRFVLQKYVQGIEVGVGTYFNGKNFLTPITISFEYKRLFPEDLGPLTNDMGATMLWQKTNKFYRESLLKMEDKLRKSGYVGYFDLNCIITKTEIHPLEFTCRFGYPTIDVQLAALAMPVGEFFYRLASGEDFEIKVKSGYQIGVCACVPPYIDKNPELKSIYHELPVAIKDGTDPLKQNGIYFKDLKYIKNNLLIAGESSYLFCATGTGKTLKGATVQAYKRLNNFGVLNMFYRNDIGLLAMSKIETLKKWGYLN